MARSEAIPARQRGMTLIEILVVIAIIGLLGSLLAYGLLDPGVKAQIKASRDLMETLSGAAKQFQLELGYYPPDGKDEPVSVTLEDGRTVTLRDPLYYYLTHQWDKSTGVSESGTRGQTHKVGPFLKEVKAAWLNKDPKDTPIEELRFVDSWKGPILYDNVVSGLSLQADQGPDPRAANVAEFERLSMDIALWSLGRDRKDPEDDLKSWKAAD